MKKVLLVLIAIIGFSVFFLSCKKDTIKVTGITLNSEHFMMKQGDWNYLNASVEPWDATNQEITWKIRDPSVASYNFSSGVVWAEGEGETVITFTTVDGGFEARATIIVFSSLGGTTWTGKDSGGRQCVLSFINATNCTLSIGGWGNYSGTYTFYGSSIWLQLGWEESFNLSGAVIDNKMTLTGSNGYNMVLTKQ